MVRAGHVAKVVAAAVALLVGTAAPARADAQSTSFSGFLTTGDVKADDTCVSVPVTYDFTAMDTTYHWSLDLESDATNGDFEYGDGGASGKASVLWCPADLTGHFHVTGTLKVEDDDYKQIADDAVNLQFAVEKRVTTSTLQISDRTPKVKQPIRLSGCVSADGRREAYRSLTLQTRKPDAGWTKLGLSMTDEAGCFSEPAQALHAGTRYLRAFVAGTHSRTGVYSSVVAIRTHR